MRVSTIGWTATAVGAVGSIVGAAYPVVAAVAGGITLVGVIVLWRSTTAQEREADERIRQAQAELQEERSSRLQLEQTVRPRSLTAEQRKGLVEAVRAI